MIQNVSAEDAGFYECHGRNDQNTAHHRIHLLVGGRFAILGPRAVRTGPGHLQYLYLLSHIYILKFVDFFYCTM